MIFLAFLWSWYKVTWRLNWYCRQMINTYVEVIHKTSSLKWSIYKPHWRYQNSSPLDNGIYLTATINKPQCVMEIAPLQTSLPKWEKHIPWGHLAFGPFGKNILHWLEDIFSDFDISHIRRNGFWFVLLPAWCLEVWPWLMLGLAVKVIEKTWF